MYVYMPVGRMCTFHLISLCLSVIQRLQAIACCNALVSTVILSYICMFVCILCKVFVLLQAFRHSDYVSLNSC